jgi:hypothetical protein
VLRTTVEVFGWVAAVLGVAAYGSAVVIGPYTSKPENRNSEDLIVIPLLLALVSVAFALVAVAAVACLAVQRRAVPEARTLVPALFSTSILAMGATVALRLA